VSHKIVCPLLIKCVAKPGISSMEFVRLKETCEDIYHNTRLFCLIFVFFKFCFYLKGQLLPDEQKQEGNYAGL